MYETEIEAATYLLIASRSINDKQTYTITGA